MDMEKAEKAIRGGAVAGFIVAGITTLITLIAMQGIGGERLAYWNDPFVFADVALVAALSFGLLRRSRICALLLFLYFLLAKIVIAMETGQMQGPVMAVIVLWFFGRAVWGTFAWHRLQAAGNPDYKAGGKLGYILMIPLGLVVLAVVALVILGSIGPKSYVVSGDDLSADERSLLVDSGMVDPGEKILMFYSAGLFSIEEEGNILTSRRVISYEVVDGELWKAAASFDDIRDFTVVEQGDLLTDTTLLVTLHNGDGFYLALSAENGGDGRFIDALGMRLR